MKYIFPIVLSILFSTKLLAQASIVEVANGFSNLDVSQSKVVSYANNLPRNGAVKYINWASLDQICNNDQITIVLPNENSGQPISFDLIEVDFTSESEYSLFGRSEFGNISLYVTPQGIGGTIDLISRVYSAFPLGGTKGTLIELLPDENDRSVCGTEDSKNRPEENYCHKDCGSAVLDVLALVTPEARQWVTDTWGWVGDWFLYVETHNINGAFINSAIPNKRVRVKIMDYTPDFDLFPDIYIDMNTLKNSQSVKQLAFQNGADISILLTNSGYVNINDISGAIPSEQGDPSATNKVGIVEVNHIGPISYTFAHEVAHHFGCWHSVPIKNGCSNGKYMEIGRNTIMGNGIFFPYAAPYSRIQHFSNPDVLFGGEPTGDYVVRDNAAQIRGAFCEVANHSPDKFGVSFSKNSTGPICAGETHTFISNLFEGNCIDLATMEYSNCSVPPYQYEWSISSTPTFTNSQIIGNTPSITFTLPYCPLYLRLTANSGNGLTASATQLFLCAPGVVCNDITDPLPERNTAGVSDKRPDMLCIPNPASDQISVYFSGTGSTVRLTILDLTGRVRRCENIYMDAERINLDISDLEQGAWFLHIEGANTKQAARFFIHR